jgi:hypothetical protein
MVMMSPDDDEILAQINRETYHFDVPESGVIERVAGADPADLARYGVPPMPDRDTQPELYDFWVDVFSRSLKPVPVTFSYTPKRPGYFGRGGTIPARSRYQSSRNWSGASIMPRDGRMFTQVVGAWKVPSVKAPPADGEYHSSTWIGLDGQRKYLDSTLPQIGTAQYVTRAGTTVTHETTTWVQWWPGPSVTIDEMPVSPGDVMVAWMIVLNSLWVQFFILNLTSPPPVPFAPFNRPAPTVPWRDEPGLRQAKVSGATAEWVMERPMVWGSDVLYELPDYNPPPNASTPRVPFRFSNCYAVSARAPGVLGRVESLRDATLINMFTYGKDPHRAVRVSTASRVDAFSFETTYRP